jgi:hypothetical protein
MVTLPRISGGNWYEKVHHMAQAIIKAVVRRNDNTLDLP